MKYIIIVLYSVVDQHRFNASLEPDPNFQVDADLDPDPDWHQNDADPHADLTPSLTYVGILIFSFLFTFSRKNIATFHCVSFSSVSNVSYVFSILDSILL